MCFFFFFGGICRLFGSVCSLSCERIGIELRRFGSVWFLEEEEEEEKAMSGGVGGGGGGGGALVVVREGRVSFGKVGS